MFARKSLLTGKSYMKRLTEDWLKAAKDDLDVIEKIIGEDHLSHIS